MTDYESFIKVYTEVLHNERQLVTFLAKKIISQTLLYAYAYSEAAVEHGEEKESRSLVGDPKEGP